MANPQDEATATTDETPSGGGDHLSLARALTLLHSGISDDPLDQLLQLVGRGMRVSRSYLIQFRDDLRFMDNTHEWCAPGIQPQKERLQALPTRKFPWWMERLLSNDGIAITDLDDLPAEAEAERQILDTQGIRAVLVLPLRSSTGDLLGFMGFDQVNKVREWSRRETESLRLICQLGTRELELRRAGQALRRLQERLIRTEQIARVGGWEFDPSTGTTWWSDEASRILSLPAGRGSVTLFDFFQRLHPDDRERARRTTLTAFDEKRSFRFECRLLPVDSMARHVEVQGDFLEREDGDRVVVGTLQDVTRRRQLEDHLSQAQRMEAVGRLAGGVAHDFNNLLAVILGNTELLLEEDAPQDSSPGGPSREDLIEIREAAERGAALTRKLLAFSRRQVLELRRIELNGVLAGMHDMLRRLLPEELDLQVQLSPEVGFVQADGGQLEQVVLNLAVNARDAMDPGGTLRISTSSMTLEEALELEPAQTLSPGHYAVLSVADDGHGMPAEVRARVFEPFYSTRGPDEGAGMGLPAVYGIARQSGGAISVESEPGVGTRFQLFLPMEATQDEEGSGAEDGLRGEGSTVEIPALNLLLVEDDPAVARMARRVLERAGYRVLVAHRPADAIRLSREEKGRLSLLITDVVMPDMRGRDLLHELRRDRPDLQALFISGYPLGTDVLAENIEPGAAFLPKPFSMNRLLNTVRQSLDEAVPAGG
jgi:two-component system, cell cycle sensor histidine kinase and response regulator CckA